MRSQTLAHYSEPTLTASPPAARLLDTRKDMYHISESLLGHDSKYVTSCSAHAFRLRVFRQGEGG